MIRRLSALREAFGVDEPHVYILAPDAVRAVPAGDTRRGTAWIFRTEGGAARFMVAVTRASNSIALSRSNGTSAIVARY